MKLSQFRVLTFDCYGTLIDWESGIHAALAPLLGRLGRAPSRDAALEAFARHESAQERETPALRYAELLAAVHRRLAAEWGVEPREEEDRRFGASVPDWPAFADSPDALLYLKRHYKLVILSNVDRAGFAASNRRLGVEFDAVFTAEDIGSYKPDPANFHYMLDRLAERGHGKAEILHTAQSLFHDHVPAKAIGLSTAWINRRHGKTGPGATRPTPPVTPDFVANSMGEFAAQHQALRRA